MRKIKAFLYKLIFDPEYREVEGMILLSFLIFTSIIWAGLGNVDFNYVSTVILSVTLLAIFWNTVMSYKLKNLTAKQITLNIRPVVVFSIDSQNSYMKNLGPGIAMNIRSEKVRLNFPPGYRKINYLPDELKTAYIAIDNVISLEPNLSGEWKNLPINILNEHNKPYKPPSQTVKKAIREHLKKITILYDDIDGRTYKAHLERDISTLRIVRYSQ